MKLLSTGERKIHCVSLRYSWTPAYPEEQNWFKDALANLQAICIQTEFFFANRFSKEPKDI
jgi:hypothetical protein